MKLSQTILLTAGLSLAACASTSHRNANQTEAASASMLTVHVVEASGGA